MLQIELEADPVLQAAAEWFFELRSDNVAGERIAEWQQWLAQDVGNRDAFERIESFWRVAEQIELPCWPTDEDVARDSYLGAQGIAAWRAAQMTLPEVTGKGSSSARIRRPLRPTGRLAAAASIVILGTLAVAHYWSDIAVRLNGGARVYVETQIGEMRTLSLPDGSVLSAGGQTSLVVTLIEHSRTVALKNGEAFFHVAKDPARPFTVEAGGTAVTAVGTAFDVRRNRDRVVVAVAEGSVRIAGAGMDAHAGGAVPTPNLPNDLRASGSQLTAGQRLSVDHTGSALTRIDSRGVAGWREGRLQYINEPLEAVVADLARYSARKIVVDDPEVSALRVTGVVFQQNVDAWLASLEATFPVRVVRQAEGSVRLERR